MNVICVDDERPALENFKYTVMGIENVDDVELFQRGTEALEWIKRNKVDIAFLDIEMADIQGVELARRIYELDPKVYVVFVTAYEKYAIDAFGVNTIGYVLKPYDKEDIRNELKKLDVRKTEKGKKVVIETIPDFVVKVDGIPIYFGRAKVKELLALLVDRGEKGITSGDAIAYLWPDKPDDANSKSLFRVTLKRLVDNLREYGIENIIDTNSREKHIVKNMVDCDLYKILDKDEEIQKKYNGYYMQEFSWAESTNALLNDLTGYTGEE